MTQTNGTLCLYVLYGLKISGAIYEKELRTPIDLGAVGIKNEPSGCPRVKLADLYIYIYIERERERGGERNSQL